MRISRLLRATGLKTAVTAAALVATACGPQAEVLAIESFEAVPPTIIEGDSATLAWLVVGSVDRLVLTGDRDAAVEGENVTGESSYTVSPDATTEYTLTATGPAGSDTATTTVSVVEGSSRSLAVETFAEGFAQPTSITHAGDGSGRLFVTERSGLIKVIEDGAVVEEPFLDVSDLVTTGGGEQGLLGLAFHPEYAGNGQFFVNYTDTGGDTVVARYLVSEDPNRVDPDSAAAVITVEQTFANHNGGQLKFGPDGYLYVGMGDGGSGGDPRGDGQNLATLLGAMLRLDVDTQEPYAVPPDNPFVEDAGARDEIWAYGLRNPWRFSFDRETGDLWIADVGQSHWEEVNLQPAGSEGGDNYGWNIMEGTHCFPPGSECDPTGLTLPVLEYENTRTNCSVTGGYRYRGEEMPELAGIYFFSDYCSGTLWGATEDAGGEWAFETLLETNFRVSTFGEDEDGELYIADYASGVIARLEAP